MSAERPKRKSRSKRKDIDDILHKWSYTPGEVTARLVTAADGRELVQMRLDMGVLQMEVNGRPDGNRPGKCDSYYDYLVELAFQESDELELSEEQCIEVDREFVQYYHRRISWLALRRFREAVRDADHTLALMDFTHDHSPEEDWTLSHEQYRPFVLFHRTQALALAELEDDGPEAAIASIKEGLDRMHKVFVEYDAQEHYEDDELVSKLVELSESLRSHYEIGQTLQEQLTEAIATEQYERAAKLRDKIARREPDED